MGWTPLYHPDTDELNDMLRLEQLRLVAHNLRPNFVVMPLGAAVVCAIFYRWLPQQQLALWFVVAVAGVAPQSILFDRFLKTSPSPSSAQAWLVAATVAGGALAAGWSSMVFLLWVPQHPLAQMLIMLVLGCTLAASTAVAGASPLLNNVTLSIYGTAFAIAPLRWGGQAGDALSVLAVIYVAYLAFVGSSIHATATDMFVLMHERTGLVDGLKAAKDESDRARERAEHASLAKSQFLANMSHELRTPLNAILGFSEMMNIFAADAEKMREYSGFIHDSGAHLLALINDILDLAKIEAGSVALRDSEFGLSPLLCDCARLLLPRAADGGITLNCDYPHDLPAVCADERALRQVLLNLLSNAVKFTPPGGTVTAFAALAADGSLQFGVRDSGVGIAEEDLSRVFEKFGQGRHDVTTADRGTGLGLAIVKGLVEAHGGTIALQSHIGEGTCVTVTLPPERCVYEKMRAVG